MMKQNHGPVSSSRTAKQRTRATIVSLAPNNLRRASVVCCHLIVVLESAAGRRGGS